MLHFFQTQGASGKQVGDEVASRGDTERRLGSKARGRRNPSARRSGLCGCDLVSQNSAYQGTGGVSENNRASGFLPAYQHLDSGETALSRFSDGRPAPIHLLDGLPQAWVADRDASGRAQCLIAGITVGFVREGRFYTREEAARWLADRKASA